MLIQREYGCGWFIVDLATISQRPVRRGQLLAPEVQLQVINQQRRGMLKQLGAVPVYGLAP
jgi:hypothetical protein